MGLFVCTRNILNKLEQLCMKHNTVVAMDKENIASIFRALVPGEPKHANGSMYRHSFFTIW